VSDVNLCFTLPMFSFVSLKVLGIDLLPFLAAITTGMFLVFLIRNLQEK
jgi:hypothetical protein